MMVNSVSFGLMTSAWDLLYLVWLVCQFEIGLQHLRTPLFINISFSPVKSAVSVDNCNLVNT
jgi:hypothetical protein